MTSDRFGGDAARHPLAPTGQVPGTAGRSGAMRRDWAGETDYGRAQLKPAPFSPSVVGGYVFLAGLSGSSALIGALADLTQKRPGERRDVTRRAHYLALLAPTIGSALLVYDLHTPQRFYNMMRVAKKTSPMSIGTWLLLGFSAAAGAGGVAQIATDLEPHWRWPHRIAKVAQVPAALFGAGISTYTAALVSATSTPVWAAAPRATAVRFASSSIATAAAVLAGSSVSSPMRRKLADLLLAALGVEIAATYVVAKQLDGAGIGKARFGRWAWIERIVAGGFGTLLPAALLVGSRLLGRRSAKLDRTAGYLATAGSLAFRIAFLGHGMESASRPEISLRFAQPDNLPTAKR